MTAAAVETPDLWSAVDARADATPDAEVLVDRAGRRVTFAELRDRSLAMAAVMV